MDMTGAGAEIKEAAQAVTTLVQALQPQLVALIQKADKMVDDAGLVLADADAVIHELTLKVDRVGQNVIEAVTNVKDVTDLVVWVAKTIVTPKTV